MLIFKERDLLSSGKQSQINWTFFSVYLVYQMPSKLVTSFANEHEVHEEHANII